MKIHSAVCLFVILCFASSISALFNDGAGEIPDLITPVIGIKAKLIGAAKEKVHGAIGKKIAFKKVVLGGVSTGLLGLVGESGAQAEAQADAVASSDGGVVNGGGEIAESFAGGVSSGAGSSSSSSSGFSANSLRGPTETFSGPSSYDAGYEYPEPQNIQVVPQTPHVQYGPAEHFPQQSRSGSLAAPPIQPAIEYGAAIHPHSSHQGSHSASHSHDGHAQLSLPHAEAPPPFDVRTTPSLSQNSISRGSIVQSGSSSLSGSRGGYAGSQGTIISSSNNRVSSEASNGAVIGGAVAEAAAVGAAAEAGAAESAFSLDTILAIPKKLAAAKKAKMAKKIKIFAAIIGKLAGGLDGLGHGHSNGHAVAESSVANARLTSDSVAFSSDVA